MREEKKEGKESKKDHRYRISHVPTQEPVSADVCR